MSLAHNGDSQLADSNMGEAQGYLYNNVGRLASSGRSIWVTHSSATPPALSLVA